MKNYSTLLILLFFSFCAQAQDQTITLCKENRGCEWAKVNLTKPQIDAILTKPNFMVREKGEVILNMVNCVSSIEKNTTPQGLHQKYGGNGTIKEIKHFDLKKYLLDNACSPRCNFPLLPNAGLQANVKMGLNANFTFTNKFTFSVESPEGNFKSFFYLNLQNGYSLMNNEAMKLFVSEELEGEVNQVLTSQSDFYQYMSTSEGKYCMKLGGKNENQLGQSQKLTANFFKTFKKTGLKKIISGTYESEEYKGISEGIESSIWLSCSDGITVDTKVTYVLTGFFGLGYVVNPSGETFLVTAIEGNGMKIQLLNIEKQIKSFLGKNYKPMGEIMAQAMRQNQSEIEEMQNNENPYARAMSQEMINNANTFSQTNDIHDLPSAQMASSVEFNSNYYDFIIIGLQQSIEDSQKSIANLDKRTTNYAKIKAELQCLKNCAVNEKARFEKIKSLHLSILSQYKNDIEKRDFKINELMQSQGIPNPCNCS